MSNRQADIAISTGDERIWFKQDVKVEEKQVVEVDVLARDQAEAVKYVEKVCQKAGFESVNDIREENCAAEYYGFPHE